MLGVATANPPTRFAKAECLVAIEKAAWFAPQEGRAHRPGTASVRLDQRSMVFKRKFDHKHLGQHDRQFARD